MISVLIPSRGRPEMLRRSVTSLLERACSRTEVQVVIAVDPDDLVTLSVVHDLGDLYGEDHQRTSIESALETRRSYGIGLLVPRERYGYSQLHRYYNELASLSDGQWLVLWNDDAVMTTQDWDSAIRAMGPECLVADLQHNLSPEFVCFPAIRREMYEAMDFFSGPTPHVDSFIQDVGRALGVVRPVDVWVDHHRPDLTGEAPDATFLEGRAGLSHEAYFALDGEIQAEIKAATQRVRAACL